MVRIDYFSGLFITTCVYSVTDKNIKFLKEVQLAESLIRYAKQKMDNVQKMAESNAVKHGLLIIKNAWPQPVQITAYS